MTLQRIRDCAAVAFLFAGIGVRRLR
jgi:hypothetical protein